jgi:hypothetical protein
MTTDPTEAVTDLVYRPTQVYEDRVDLTVAEVYTVDQPGRIDFGGDELTEATLAPVDRYWRDPDDDYQWWELSAGQYLIAYNERLATDTPLVVQPRPALLERGGAHPTVRTTTLPTMPLAVGAGGVHLKENARVSMVVADS